MEEYPFVSVIIPALNAESTIGLCLESIKLLDYPVGKLEIIVVDNGSTDRTREIAESFGAKVLHKPKLKVGALRNYGAKIANGEVLAFTDSDCLVPKSWLIEAVEILKDGNIGATGGGYLVPENATWIERAWVVLPQRKHGETLYLPTGSFILRKEIFEKIGGFDEKLIAGEDDDISIRIRKAGYTLILCSNCYVLHLGYPKTLYQVVRKQIWHGQSMLFSIRHFFSMLSILSHLFTISLILMPIAIILAIKYSYWPLLVPLFFIFMLPPSLLSCKKFFRNNIRFDKIALLHLFIIYIAYFCGRSIALLYVYKALFARFRKFF